MRIPEPPIQRACACGGECADCRSQHPDEGHAACGGGALLPSRVRVRRSETQRALEVAGPDEEARRWKAAEEAEASSYADAHLLGLDLAARMEQARINGEATARLVLGPAYGGLDDIDRRFIAGAIRTIALIVRKHLLERAAGVRSVIVLFGVINNVTPEVIDLPE
jgi:hypothetical protein